MLHGLKYFFEFYKFDDTIRNAVDMDKFKGEVFFRFLRNPLLDPTHSYEIACLMAVNLLYMIKSFKSRRTNFFIGGGICGLEVPKCENESDEMERGFPHNMEVGINVRVFWKSALHSIGKYKI